VRLVTWQSARSGELVTESVVGFDRPTCIFIITVLMPLLGDRRTANSSKTEARTGLNNLLNVTVQCVAKERVTNVAEVYRTYGKSRQQKNILFYTLMLPRMFSICRRIFADCY